MEQQVVHNGQHQHAQPAAVCWCSSFISNDWKSLSQAADVTAILPQIIPADGSILGAQYA
jgi:hypothetical protein